MDSFQRKMFHQAIGYFEHIQSLDDEQIKQLEQLIAKYKNVKKEIKNGDKVQ